MRTTVLQHNKCYLINWFIKYWTVKVIIKLRVELGEIKSKNWMLWWIRVGKLRPSKKETMAGAFYGMTCCKVLPSNFGAVAMADINGPNHVLYPCFVCQLTPFKMGPNILPAHLLQFLWENRRYCCMHVLIAIHCRSTRRSLFQLHIQYAMFLLLSVYKFD